MVMTMGSMFGDFRTSEKGGIPLVVAGSLVVRTSSSGG